MSEATVIHADDDDAIEVLRAKVNEIANGYTYPQILTALVYVSVQNCIEAASTPAAAKKNVEQFKSHLDRLIKEHAHLAGGTCTCDLSVDVEKAR